LNVKSSSTLQDKKTGVNINTNASVTITDSTKPATTKTLPAKSTIVSLSSEKRANSKEPAPILQIDTKKQGSSIKKKLTTGKEKQFVDEVSDVNEETKSDGNPQRYAFKEKWFTKHQYEYMDLRTWIKVVERDSTTVRCSICPDLPEIKADIGIIKGHWTSKNHQEAIKSRKLPNQSDESEDTERHEGENKSNKASRKRRNINELVIRAEIEISIWIAENCVKKVFP